MNDYWLYAILLAIVIIAILGFYAGNLLRQLAKQNKMEQEAKLAHQKALAEHDHKVLSSVLLITRAMKEEQCEFDEGCWRLSVLLDSLKTSSKLEQQFPAIFKLYNGIKHLAILEERKKLSKQQRMKEDYQRMTTVADMHQEIVSDLDLLQQYTTERMSILRSAP
ncbi:MAG: DUF2489 domain-containing protein [Litorilituus sp.]|nr:DUF2489 domain-containing protein [Litorilituus sp.]